jgi:GNAT superfamily N-acetyltransferase
MEKKIIIRAPKGFNVRYHIYTYNKEIESVYCELYDITKSSWHDIGRVVLERGIGKVFETHSDLEDKYRGKGLGTLLYSKAIAWALNNGFKVKSSGDSSDMAQRVWEGKGLRKHFNIRKINKKHLAYPYDSNRVLYTSETWHATKKGASVKRRKKK